jgi:hypothetical protein
MAVHLCPSCLLSLSPGCVQASSQALQCATCPPHHTADLHVPTTPLLAAPTWPFGKPSLVLWLVLGLRPSCTVLVCVTVLFEVGPHLYLPNLWCGKDTALCLLVGWVYVCL